MQTFEMKALLHNATCLRQFCYDTNYTQNCKVYKHTSQSSSLATFLFQYKALYKVESGSTFRNERGNVATHSQSIAQCITPLLSVRKRTDVTFNACMYSNIMILDLF